AARAASCGGEMDLTASPARSASRGNGPAQGYAESIQDVKLLRIDDGALRCVPSDQISEAVSGRSLASRAMAAAGGRPALPPGASSAHVSLPLGHLLPGPIYREIPDMGAGGGAAALVPAQAAAMPLNPALRELQKIHRLLRGRYLYAA